MTVARAYPDRRHEEPTLSGDDALEALSGTGRMSGFLYDGIFNQAYGSCTGNEPQSLAEARISAGLQSRQHQLDRAERFHDLYEVASALPWTGAQPALLNAGAYFREGNHSEGALSLLGAIPVVGMIRAGRAIHRIAKSKNLESSLPEGSKVLATGGGDKDAWLIYQDALGDQRIRFRAALAKTENAASRGRNYTPKARAGIDSDGNVFVIEGKHRAVGSANGDVIPKANGGVDGHPGVLDYHFDPRPIAYPGISVKDLKIDYTLPDVSPGRAEAMRAMWEPHRWEVNIEHFFDKQGRVKPPWGKPP